MQCFDALSATQYLSFLFSLNGPLVFPISINLRKFEENLEGFLKFPNQILLLSNWSLSSVLKGRRPTRCSWRMTAPTAGNYTVLSPHQVTHASQC